MNFHGTKKLLLKVSHNLWAQNQKLFSNMGFEILGLVCTYHYVIFTLSFQADLTNQRVISREQGEQLAKVWSLLTCLIP